MTLRYFECLTISITTSVERERKCYILNHSGFILKFPHMAYYVRLFAARTRPSRPVTGRLQSQSDHTICKHGV